MKTDLTDRLRRLVILNEVEHGGPYQGTAATLCMEAMTEAIGVIEAERALADAQAAVLASYFDEGDGRYILADDPPLPDVVAVMARWREARGR